MRISTSLRGRLRNTVLPKSGALLPLYEAIVNAIQSVDARYPEGDSGRVEIEILRDAQLTLVDGAVEPGNAATSPIIGFEIRDNGEGFTDDNLESFETLDSEYKSKIGCRGVGRLLWLKAFDRVEVVSAYRPGVGETRRRTFSFTRDDGIADHHDDPSEDDAIGATVKLIRFEEKYRKAASKRTASIARGILEHCLWYFVRPGSAPSMVVIDGDERLDLNELYDEYMISSSDSDRVKVKGVEFHVTHLRLKAGANTVPHLSWCAADRLVTEENLSGKIKGLHGKIGSGDDEFLYAAFLTSDYLDDRVRPERTEFDIPEDTSGMLDDTEPSLGEIRAAALSVIEDHLGEQLAEKRQAGRERITRFVDHKAPRYRPVLSYIDASVDLNPESSDRDLELQLHQGLTDLERDLLEQGHRVFDPMSTQDEEYDEQVRSYLTKLEDVNKSDLAAYVARRRVVIDLFQRAIEIGDDGKYAREGDIHNLIMQMRTTSNDVRAQSANLWLIDERLAFHNFLASDKTISSMPITDSSSNKEPDLVALQLFDNPLLVSESRGMPLGSITVVEIKRPMRNDAAEGEEKDPIEQALSYVDRIREGGVKTAAGRAIQGPEGVPGFVYVIADLTPRLEMRCKLHSLRRTQDGTGYFGYNENFGAYIEVMSFDKLLNDAKQRNRAFFDKLGLPAN